MSKLKPILPKTEVPGLADSIIFLKHVIKKDFQQIIDENQKSFPPKFESKIAFESYHHSLQNLKNCFKKQNVCASCGQWFVEGISKAKDWEPLKKLQLKNANDFPEEFFKYQDSKIDGLCLEKKGITNFHVHLCVSCYKVLNDKNKKVVKYSLANGNYVGDTPSCFKDLSFLETKLIAKVRFTNCIIKLQNFNNGSHLAIKGNYMAFLQSPELIGTLPLHSSSMQDTIKCLQIQSRNNMEGGLKAKDLKKLFIVRKRKILECLFWLKENNQFYKEVVISKENLESYFIEKNQTETVPYFIQKQLETIVEEDKEELGYVGPNDFLGEVKSTINTINDLNASIVVDQTLSGHSDSEGSWIELIRDYLLFKTNENVLVMGCQTKGFDMNSPSFWYYAFPTLYPYGRGALYEPNRKVPISQQEFVKMHMKWADIRFQAHYDYLFLNFNILERKKVLNSLYYHVPQMNKQKLDEVVNLKETDIDDAIKILVSKKSLPLNHPASKISNIIKWFSTKPKSPFLSKVDKRHEISALITRYGLPSFYITISPSEIHSHWFWKEKMNTLDDINDILDKFDNLKKREQLVGQNPIDNSRFFNKLVSIIIDYCFGYKTSAGILGKISTYYGVVEDQQRGSLHIHLLFWLPGRPEPKLFEQLLMHPNSTFKSEVFQYLNQTVFLKNPITNEIDLELDANEDWRFAPPPDPNDPDFWKKSSFIINSAIDSYQKHVCRSSCFKNGKLICRYRFPKELFLCDTYDIKTGQFNQKRDNPFTNAFNFWLLLLTNSNVDIQFLPTGASAVNIAWYISCYMSKNLDLAALCSILKNTFVSLKKYPLVGENNTHQQAKNFLTRFFSQRNRFVQIASTLVSSYIADLPLYYCPETFEKLSIYSLVENLASGSFDEHFQNEQPKYFSDFDYYYRPDELENMSLYAFKRYLTKGSINKSHFKFKFAHPESEKSGLYVRINPIIPVILSPFATLNSESVEIQFRSYASFFILFTPWRILGKKSLSELKNDYDNFDWSHISSVFAKRFILTVPSQDDLAKQHNEMTHNIEQQLFVKEKSTLNTGNIKKQHIILYCDPEKTYFTTFFSNKDQLFFNKPISTLDLAFEIVNSQINEQLYSVSPTEYSNLSQEWNTALKISNLDTVTLKRKFDYINTETSEYSHEPKTLLLPLSFNISKLQVVYKDIMHKFKFNFKQKQGFNMIYNHIMKTMISPNTSQAPLFSYIGGEGGTGKSWIIEAINHTAELLGINHWFRIMAFTGAAAGNVNGSTIHSVLKFTHTKRLSKSALIELSEELQHVRYFILDEISLIDQELLSSINSRLREISKHERKPDDPFLFGNYSILSFGDFYQLPPVASRPLYDPPKYSELNLWHYFKNVIFLNEQIRAAADQKYLECLRRLRFRMVTVSDLNMLKERKLENLSNIKLNTKDWEEVPIISPRRSFNFDMNQNRFYSFASSNGKTIYIWPTVYCIGGCTITDLEILSALKKLNPSDKHSMVCIGARITVTSNLATELNVVNGTLGTVQKVIYDSDSVLDQTNTYYGNQIIYLSKPPIIMMKPDTVSKSLEKFFSDNNLQDKLVPICPTLSRNTKSGLLDSRRRDILIQKLHSPVVLAYAITDYKCQGSTMDRAIINLEKPIDGKTDSASPYTMLSRLRTFQGLVILGDIDLNYLNRPLNPNLKSDQIRLEALEVETIKSIPDFLFN